MVGSLKMNTALEYSTRVVQEGDRRCKKSTLNDLAYLTPLRIPLMNPVIKQQSCREKTTKASNSKFLQGIITCFGTFLERFSPFVKKVV
jgi:hypothetical protein